MRAGGRSKWLQLLCVGHDVEPTRCRDSKIFSRRRFIASSWSLLLALFSFPLPLKPHPPPRLPTATKPLSGSNQDDDGGEMPAAFAPLAAAHSVHHVSSTYVEVLGMERSVRSCLTVFVANVTCAFGNPFVKWLKSSELLETPKEEAKAHPVEEEDDSQHEQQQQPEPADLTQEQEEETHDAYVEEEDKGLDEAIPLPSSDHESKPQSSPLPHHETEPQWPQSPDANLEKTQIHDNRRLEEAAERNDEPDEFADLEGIDLSPFNMYIADKAVLVRLLDWAYDRTALLSRFHDGFVHAEELSRLFSLALNPTEENVPNEYTALIDAAADEMRDVQGLVDSDMTVPRGFVGRGMPLRMLQRLAHQMHEHHSQQTGRRLAEVASADTRDREL